MLISHKQLEDILSKYNFQILLSGNEIQTRNSPLYNETTRFELLQKENQGVILPKLLVVYSEMELSEGSTEHDALQQTKETLQKLEAEVGNEIRLEGILHQKQENKLKFYFLMQLFGLKSFFWSDQNTLQPSSVESSSNKEVTEYIPIADIKIQSKM